ncbi:MAG: ABC transporter permease [Chloroflexi bacterium]|jgi:ABC-2 type transport system permease protein|nr:ABC transporter permease [Chloroflexota bacterium]MBT7081279.1 ABC transporter permease [Chloroflexota bacterium]MBT7289964.1 ABC transporter permease [Chloroflexota bacterium]
MIKALYVALLETKIFLTDKAGLAFSLLLPIAIFALMYGAFGGQTIFHGTAYMVNQDVDAQGQANYYSDLIVEQLDGLDSLDVSILSEADAQRKLDRSDILMAFYIPEGFSDDIDSGLSSQLTIKQRGNGGDEGQIVASIVRGMVENINQQLQVHAKVAGAVGGNYNQDTVNEYLANRTVSVNTSVGESSAPDPVKEFLPGIVTMFILFGISMNARALYEERKRGTLERLVTTRLGVGQMFTGKFLSYVARGFIQTLILLSLAYAVFGGDLFTTASFFKALFICLVFSGAAGAFGLIIGSVSRSEGQAIWMAVFFTMSMVMLGGTFFPIPEDTVFFTISKFSINTYINDALRAITADNASLTSLWPELLIMAGVIVVGLAASRYMFRVISK